MFCLHFSAHVQPHQLCNEHQNANRVALEKPGRLHLVIRRNSRANGRATPLTCAAAEHTRAPAQWMWTLVFGSRATRPCPLAWPTQFFSAGCGVTQNAHVSTLHSVSTRQNCGCSARHLPARAGCRTHWQMSWRVEWWASGSLHRSMDNAIHNHRLHASRLLRVHRTNSCSCRALRDVHQHLTTTFAVSPW